jgi:hypothetical protein
VAGGQAGAASTSLGGAGGPVSLGGEGGRLGAGGAGGDAAGESGTVGLAVSDPHDRKVLEGTDATFEVTAAGRSIAFQWQRAGNSNTAFVDIPGANSNLLLLPSVAVGESGSRYRVVVSDGTSTILSKAATLYVVPSASGALVALTSGAMHQQGPLFTSWAAGERRHRSGRRDPGPRFMQLRPSSLLRRH